jgi:hypothetical protein
MSSPLDSDTTVEDLAQGIGITIFIGNDQDGAELGVGLVLRHLPLFEFEGQPFPGLLMTPDQARRVARALVQTANEIES